MLTLSAGQAESLWDEALPVELRELPDDLAALDGELSDPELLGPIVERWRREVLETGRAVLTDGRPTIAMETYVRLRVLKQRFRWGYRTLVAEVSDSIHLRRFCRISLSERVPDESTVAAVGISNRRLVSDARTTPECDAAARLAVAGWRFPHRRTFTRQPPFDGVPSRTGAGAVPCAGSDADRTNAGA